MSRLCRSLWATAHTASSRRDRPWDCAHLQSMIWQQKKNKKIIYKKLGELVFGLILAVTCRGCPDEMPVALETHINTQWLCKNKCKKKYQYAKNTNNQYAKMTYERSVPYDQGHKARGSEFSLAYITVKKRHWLVSVCMQIISEYVLRMVKLTFFPLT